MKIQYSFLSQYEEAQVKRQRHIFKKLETDKIIALEWIEKILFMNFEHHDLAIHMVDVCKNWNTYGNSNEL